MVEYSKDFRGNWYVECSFCFKKCKSHRGFNLHKRFCPIAAGANPKEILSPNQYYQWYRRANELLKSETYEWDHPGDKNIMATAIRSDHDLEKFTRKRTFDEYIADSGLEAHGRNEEDRTRSIIVWLANVIRDEKDDQQQTSQAEDQPSESRVKQCGNKYYPFRDRDDYAMGLWFRKHCNDSKVDSYFAYGLGRHWSFQSAKELRQKNEERQRWKVAR